MQYLVLTCVMGFIAAVFIFAGIKTVGMKERFLQRIVAKKIMGKGVFSTLAICRLSRYILKQPFPLRQSLLKNINENDFESLSKAVEEQKVRACLDLMLGKRPKGQINDNLYNLMLADYNVKRQNIDKAVAVLQNLANSELTKKEQAYKMLLTSKIALFEGDLQIAVDDAGRALKAFQKADLLLEEAEAYFILGTIYRVSGVFDAADFMLRAALKLFGFAGFPKAEAEVLGTLGLLMSVQKRFEEAEDYLLRSKEVFKTAGDGLGQRFIECQQAMLDLLKGNALKAEKAAKEILKGRPEPEIAALSSDIAARALFFSKKWKQVLPFAKTAAEQYLAQKNFAAAFECRYIQAESLVNQNNLDEAELVLRELIRKESHHKTCFHIANAHTLLGLVFLQKNDIPRAKAIFNQALSQELHDERLSGIAIDYANLAVVERRCGNLEASHKNLEMALSYAKGSDEELYSQIKSALD